MEKEVKKSNLKKYFLVLVVVIFAVVILEIYSYAKKPSHGSVNNSGKTSNASVEQKVNVPETFKGKYLTFMYDNIFLIKSHAIAKDDSAVILESAYLSETGAISKKIALSVRKLLSHSLEDVPDYLMRKANPKKYKLATFSMDGVSGQMFVPADDSTFEKTYFIPHGDLVAILAVTSPALPDEQLNKEADILAKSIQWKK